MSLFSKLQERDHEEIVFFQNREVGLKAIIAIHDTTLGPALGGTRMFPYQTEEEAVTDVIRLSQGMTCKAAAAGLNLGGGKAVIIGDPRTDKSEALFRAFGRYIESLKGRFITGEDLGIDVNDVEYMFMETRYVCGLSTAHGGGGDPGPVTAFGVLQGIKACVQQKMGHSRLQDLVVAVQGLGGVGMPLSRLLHKEGAKLIATDIDEQRLQEAVQELEVTACKPGEIYEAAAQIFSPCALGAVINDETLPRMQFQIIAGAANNQLQEDRHGFELHRRGILYAPDYVVNAGGMINVFVELEGYDRQRALRMTRGIFYNLTKVFRIAEREGIPTFQAANHLAQERIQLVRHLKGMYLGQHLSRSRWEERLAPV